MTNEEQGIKPYVIGLDLGGTNSVFGIVDARGEIKATTAIKTGGFNSAEDYVKAAVEALQPIIEQVGGIEKIKAMGIGAPNGNYYKGTIERHPICLGLTTPSSHWPSSSASSWREFPLHSPMMPTPLPSVKWSMVWLVA